MHFKCWHTDSFTFKKWCILYLKDHKSNLATDELTTVRRNLQTGGIEVTNDFVSLQKLFKCTCILLLDTHLEQYTRNFYLPVLIRKKGCLFFHFNLVLPRLISTIMNHCRVSLIIMKMWSSYNFLSQAKLEKNNLYLYACVL